MSLLWKPGGGIALNTSPLGAIEDYVGGEYSLPCFILLMFGKNWGYESREKERENVCLSEY